MVGVVGYNNRDNLEFRHFFGKITVAMGSNLGFRSMNLKKINGKTSIIVSGSMYHLYRFTIGMILSWYMLVTACNEV